MSKKGQQSMREIKEMAKRFGAGAVIGGGVGSVFPIIGTTIGGAIVGIGVARLNPCILLWIVVNQNGVISVRRLEDLYKSNKLNSFTTK